MNEDLLDWCRTLSQAIEDRDYQKIDNLRVDINTGGLALEEKAVLNDLITSIGGMK